MTDSPWYRNRPDCDWLLTAQEAAISFKSHRNDLAIVMINLLVFYILSRLAIGFICSTTPILYVTAFQVIAVEVYAGLMSVIWLLIFVKTFSWCTSNPTGALKFFERTAAVRCLFPYSALLHSQALAGCGKLVEAQIAQERSLQNPRLSTYALAGDLNAELVFRRAQYDGWKTGKDQRMRTETTINLGYALLLMDRCAESIEFSEEALELINEQESIYWHSAKVNALINCARAKIRFHSVEEGEKLLEELLDGPTAIEHCTRGEMQLALTELRLRQERFEEANLYAQNAVDYYERKSGTDTLESVYAKHLLASILYKTGRSTEAADLTMWADLEEDDMITYNKSAKRIVMKRQAATPQIVRDGQATVFARTRPRHAIGQIDFASALIYLAERHATAFCQYSNSL